MELKKDINNKCQSYRVYNPKGISPTLPGKAKGNTGQNAPLIIYDPYNRKIPKNQKHSTSLRTNWADGNAWVIQKLTSTQSKSTKSISQPTKTMATQQELIPNNSLTLTSWWQDFLVKHLVSLESVEDFKTPEAHYFLKSLGFAETKDPDIFCLKMLKVYLVTNLEKLSRQYLKFSPTLGIYYNGKFSIVRTTESHRIGKECSLLGILKEKVNPKYFLSEKQVKRLIKVQNRGAKWHQQDKVYNPQKDKPNIPAGTHGSTPHLLKIWSIKEQ